MLTTKELLEVPLEGRPGSDRRSDVTINLNEMIRQALNPFMVAGRNKDVIVRCTDMPQIQGDPVLLKEVCNDLVRMIMLYPGTSKRFLHIKCEEKFLLPNSNPGREFLIEFHTNLTTDHNWKQLNQETIIACQEKLLKFQAFLTVHEISTTGCLFSISLQGKIF